MRGAKEGDEGKKHRPSNRKKRGADPSGEKRRAATGRASAGSSDGVGFARRRDRGEGGGWVSSPRTHLSRALGGAAALRVTASESPRAARVPRRVVARARRALGARGRRARDSVASPALRAGPGAGAGARPRVARRRRGARARPPGAPNARNESRASARPAASPRVVARGDAANALTVAAIDRGLSHANVCVEGAGAGSRRRARDAREGRTRSRTSGVARYRAAESASEARERVAGRAR